MQRGATPAVLRLYDAIEGDRHFSTGPDLHPLLVMDEGDPLIIDAVMEIVEQECAGAEVLDGESLLEQWLAHRNDVSSLEALISIDYVVDTMEISARWNALDAIYENARAAISAVSGTAQVSAHQSHAYSDGACLYFTFAAKPEDKEQYYRNVWDAGTNAVLAAGGSLSHHHGVGLNRARFMRSALGSGLDVLAEIKTALDPNGILNPGKLGLASEFGAAPSWP
jgi:alkyldihydroxyacetonephosphate synthase